MRQMTLRNIPDEIEMVARNEAIRQGVSLNKAFLTLLRKGSQQTIAQSHIVTTEHKSQFSRFCGVWSDKDAVEF